MGTLPLIEMFSSIQGEGPYVGVRQIFMRLPKCNLTCPYCDTQTKIPEQFKYEPIPGSHKFQYFNNPISYNEIIYLINKLNLNIHHSISITGGEPLLWSQQLSSFLQQFESYKLKTYLETNGTLPDQLAVILPWVDIISMDIKLPYNKKDFWDQHKAFLQIARGKELFIKIVLDSYTSDENLIIARDLIASENKALVTILQPVTSTNSIKTPIPSQMLKWQELFLQKLKDVRVIPQTHVLQGQL